MAKPPSDRRTRKMPDARVVRNTAESGPNFTRHVSISVDEGERQFATEGGDPR
jgi:hypothetical protein